MRTRALHKPRKLIEYLSLVSDLPSAARLARLRFGRRRAGGLLPVRLRALGGGAIGCRPGSADFFAVYDAFYLRYHAPPSELGSPETILDLGSNVGATMAEMAARFRRARLLGVELDRANWELARTNLAPYGERCRVLWGAAWPQSGKVRRVGEHDQAFRAVEAEQAAEPREALSEFSMPDSESIDGQVVRAYRVEELIDELGVETVDFIKMDVEGAEEALLVAGAGWLRRTRCLKVEIHAPVSIARCRELLEQAGFAVRRYEPHPACLVAVQQRIDRRPARAVP